MHVRILLAACLLSYSGFAEQPRRFDLGKRLVQVTPAQAKPPVQNPAVQKPVEPPKESKVCSIPLVNVTPPVAQTNMPVIGIPRGFDWLDSMPRVEPPAPACVDETARNRRPSEPRP
ncbi:MAG TPA: hypothetical protein VER03_09135 [Bryobacteraceae bacterium]|nr:hypothetical protein [Bryobacteraceae bacterium]